METDQIISFIKERNWEQFHTPKNLAIAIGAEVGELLECFQWKTDEEIHNMVQQENTEQIGYCQIKFATLDSVYHVTLPVYPVI